MGIEIVDRLAGVHHAFRPTKSLIVTTSSFTKAAPKKSHPVKTEIELKKDEDIEKWLRRRDRRDS